MDAWVTLLLALRIIFQHGCLHILEQFIVFDAVRIVILDMPFLFIRHHHAPAVALEHAGLGGHDHAQRFHARWIAPGLDQHALGVRRRQITEAGGQIQGGDTAWQCDLAALQVQLGKELLGRHFRCGSLLFGRGGSRQAGEGQAQQGCQQAFQHDRSKKLQRVNILNQLVA
ncbi:hypothetical protein D3C81_1468050 [compost metagenome]